MRNLLRTNLARLKQDGTFWGCAAAMIGFGLLCIVQRYRNAADMPVDQVFFFHFIVLSFAMAVWCAHFIGTDHSDGTLRNKLVAGHSRLSIYLTDLLTGLIVGLVLSLSNIAVIAALGIPLLGLGTAGPMRLLLLTVTGWLTTAAMVGLFTLMAELIHSKSTASVAVLLALLLLFSLGIMVNGRLDVPEYRDHYIFNDSLGNIKPDLTPNPAYLTGPLRTLYEVILDILPTGQVIQLNGMNAAHPMRMMLFSVILLAGTTALGLARFRRHDIK